MPRDSGGRFGRGGRGRGRGGPSRGRGRGQGGGNHQPREVQNNQGWGDNDMDDGQLNADLSERFGRQRISDHGDPQQSANWQPASLNEDIRNYSSKQDSIMNDDNLSAWARKGEFPSNDEIAFGADDELDLRPNKAKGAWKKKDRYLETHYELLREDALHPLRQAVDKVRKDPDMMDDRSLSIYEKVHFTCVTFSQLGLGIRVQFSTRRAGAKIKWSASKRLKAGTLVALTPADDKFQHQCIVAVSGTRPLKFLEDRADGDFNAPAIDIFFCRPEDVQIDPQKEWLMVEAKSGYFEGSRHTLRALQKLGTESFPLQSHIYGLNRQVPPPQYLVQNPAMDLTPAVAPESQHRYQAVDVVNEWPGAVDGSLDNSQWQALKNILTKSLSIVQGPPGTGKTHVSKVALEIINNYLKTGDPPIIIAAQTNHALDQLLSHVAKFQPEYIRLGGQSTNPEVRRRALWEVRNGIRFPVPRGGKLGPSKSVLRRLTEEMSVTLAPLQVGTSPATQQPSFGQHESNPTSSAAPFSAQMFWDWQIINEKQFKSLGAGAAGWLTSSGVKKDDIELWLEDRLSHFSVEYEAESYGVDEDDEDLEFEQLREQEAETGVNDEEDMELLEGKWCSIVDGWYYENAFESDLEEAEKVLSSVQDMWRISSSMRGAVYTVMQQRMKEKISAKFRAQATKYYQTLKDIQIGKWERDAVYLQEAKVIGLTTTGLSKYRALISSLKPKIVLIEEAAEVLEGPITVACMDTVEHLILVGDHQQLQGHCNDHDLETDFYLNISMFERLVKNDMPFKTLLCQRRMEPEFRQLISGLYPALTDHQSVTQRPTYEWGLGRFKSYFLAHNWSESRDAQQSTYNEEEARFVAGFYRYLYMNGVPPSNISVLTFYNGQRKKILKYLREYPELKDFYNNVKTVDSYQGEENTIVLLSLTRSNDYGQIGFLEVDNRVCVALSRAQHGFYMFGNSELLASESPLWKSVVEKLRSREALGPRLPIYCEKHRSQTMVQYPDEWKSISGGCTKPCAEQLSCGHLCTLNCHPFEHDRVNCIKACLKVLSCGHKCSKACFEDCACKCQDYNLTDQRRWDGEITNVQNNRPSGIKSHDVRLESPVEVEDEFSAYAGGKFVSGQHEFIPSSCHNIYLPEQVENRSSRGRKEDGRMNVGALLKPSVVAHNSGMKNQPADGVMERQEGVMHGDLLEFSPARMRGQTPGFSPARKRGQNQGFSPARNHGEVQGFNPAHNRGTQGYSPAHNRGGLRPNPTRTRGTRAKENIKAMSSGERTVERAGLQASPGHLRGNRHGFGRPVDSPPKIAEPTTLHGFPERIVNRYRWNNFSNTVNEDDARRAKEASLAMGNASNDVKKWVLEQGEVFERNLGGGRKHFTTGISPMKGNEAAGAVKEEEEKEEKQKEGNLIDLEEDLIEL